MTKMMLPLMMNQGGSIVNTSSFSGQAADLYRSGYNAAKGAVINFTNESQLKYGREGILVSGIVPVELNAVDKLTGTSEDDAGKTFKEN